jgi:hypothetical protein
MVHRDTTVVSVTILIMITFFSLSIFATILRFKVFQSRKFAYMLMSELGIRGMLSSQLQQ